MHLPNHHAATAGWRKERAHPVNYRGFRYAEEVMKKRKSQRTTRNKTRREFSSNLATTGLSFAAALRGSTEVQQRSQTHQVAVAGPATVERRVPAPLRQHEQQATGQSVGTSNVNSLPLDNGMLRIIIVVQQFITEFKGSVSEEEKIVVVTNMS
jgi:hypothetical protein